MNNLKDNRCYLAGAIDLAADKGKGWRDLITPRLQEFGIKVWNPMKKPIKNTALNEEDDAYFERKRMLKETEQYDEFTTMMKPVRRIDLAMVDRVDFLICVLDITIHACGTYEEISWANRCMKPVIVMCPQGKKRIPDWEFAQLPHQMFFSDWDGVFNYLKYVDETPEEQLETFNRWKFFRCE